MRRSAQGVGVSLFWIGLLTAIPSEGQDRLVWIAQLTPGDRVEIRTADYLLRLEMIDPQIGEAVVCISRDGIHFGPQERVYVLGATSGRHPEGLMVVRMGCIQIGKRLELAIGDHEPGHRRLTAPVESVQVWPSAHACLP